MSGQCGGGGGPGGLAGLSALASRGQAAQCRLDEAAAGGAGCGAGGRAAGRRVAGPAVDAGPGPGPGRRQVPGGSTPSRESGTCCNAAAGPARSARAGDRARRRRGRGVEEGDLAADKSTAAALGGWIVFEDECGQSVRPPRSTDLGAARDHSGHPGPRRRQRAHLGGRAGLLPARRPQPADLPAAPLPRAQGRDQGIHLDRVPGSAPRHPPPAARRPSRV